MNQRYSPFLCVLLAISATTSPGCVQEDSSENEGGLVKGTDLASPLQDSPGIEAACWQFSFTPVGGPFFPNPYNNFTQILKADLNLLVLDTSYQLLPATVSFEIVNGSGQLVASGTVGSVASSPNTRVNIWNGTNGAGAPVASGVYTAKAIATSDLCGSKSFSGRVVVTH